MTDVAKTGLRVHFVQMPKGVFEIVIGETYTAKCGTVWEPVTTDPDELAALPYCYGCFEERAIECLQDFKALSEALNDYDLQHPEEA